MIRNMAVFFVLGQIFWPAMASAQDEVDPCKGLSLDVPGVVLSTEGIGEFCQRYRILHTRMVEAEKNILRLESLISSNTLASTKTQSIVDNITSSGVRLEILDTLIKDAVKVTGQAGAEAVKSRNVANNALETSGRVESRIEQLNKSIESASELTKLLSNVKNIRDLLHSDKELQRQIAELVSTVPAGTVAAFDLDSCPSGWSLFSDAYGRVIVGAGEGTNLAERGFREIGGEEEHALSVDEMPSHWHGPDSSGLALIEQPLTTKLAHFGFLNTAGGDVFYFRKAEHTSATGGDQPHNNMPPYIALYFCKKD